MTYLQYNQISLAEGKSVDLAHDVVRANEERAIAIRAFVRKCARRLRGLLHSLTGHISPRHTFADDLTNR